MAITGTDRGTAYISTNATTGTFSPASNFAAGSWAVCCIALNNSQSGGGAYSTLTLTDSLGNTWTRRISPLYNAGPGTNTGVEGAIFTTPMDGGTLTTGTVLTITTSTATARRAVTLMEIVPTSGSNLAYVDGGVSTGSNTAGPTVTTSSITSGNMVIAACFNEWEAAPTSHDGDTTNGSWSTAQSDGGGTTAAGMWVSSQRKVVTATGTQTYNLTLDSTSDVILGWIQITETGAGTTVTPSPVTLTLTTFAPSVVVDTIVTPSPASLTLTPFAPNVVVDTILTPSQTSLVLTSFAPDVVVDTILTPATCQLVLTAFAPTVVSSVTVTPDPATLVLTTLSPSVVVNQIVSPAPANLVLSSFAPTVAFGPAAGWLSINGWWLGGFSLGGYSGSITVTPETCSLIITPFAPIITVGQTVVFGDPTDGWNFGPGSSAWNFENQVSVLDFGTDATVWRFGD